jgi:rRNA-processing protein EBP2
VDAVEGSPSSSDDDDDDGEKEEEGVRRRNQSLATQVVALRTALEAADRRLPWAETFDVVSPTPLPFGSLPPTASSSSSSAPDRKRKRADGDGGDGGEEEEEEEEEEVVDVHDDLKREVAFYDGALESVILARERCADAGIPFARPDDFFAEMVKSDGEP